MSSNNSEPESDDSSNDADEQPDLTTLEARIRDLEVEVYGYDPQRSAGEEAVVDMKRTIVFVDNQQDIDGAPIEDVYRIAEVIGIGRGLAEQALEKLRRQGEIYEIADEVVIPT